MPKRSRSSQRWLERQRRDPFVRAAQKRGEVSRAHYKIKQLDERFRLLHHNTRVLELGAAPGGWTNYLENRVSKGLVVAVDPSPITHAEQTVAITGHFGEEQIDGLIDAALTADVATSSGLDAVDTEVATEDDRTAHRDGGLQTGQVDLVLSDMAPNITGVRAADQAAAIGLADLAVEAAERWLRPDGNLVVKLFHGEGTEAWVKTTRVRFTRLNLVKPKASRSDSREVFAVAQGFKGELV